MMGLLKAINTRLNKSPAGKPRPASSQFLQATRAKANEARERLRPKADVARERPSPKEPKDKPLSSSVPGVTRPSQGQHGAAQAPRPSVGVQGRADPVHSTRKRTDLPVAASQQPRTAAQPSPSGASLGGSVAEAVKDMREVASGPRGGKFVSGPEGSKHYVK